MTTKTGYTQINSIKAQTNKQHKNTHKPTYDTYIYITENTFMKQIKNKQQRQQYKTINNNNDNKIRTI